MTREGSLRFVLDLDRLRVRYTPLYAPQYLIWRGAKAANQQEEDKVDGSFIDQGQIRLGIEDGRSAPSTRSAIVHPNPAPRLNAPFPPSRFRLSIWAYAALTTAVDSESKRTIVFS